VEVTLGTGGTISHPLSLDVIPFSGPALQGLTDVDGDGTEEIVAIDSCGAHFCGVAILFVRGRTLRPATIGREGGTLGVDAAALGATGFACTEVEGRPGLTLTTAEAMPGLGQWSLLVTSGVWEDTTLVLGEVVETTFPLGADGNLPREAYDRVPTIDCPGIESTYG